MKEVATQRQILPALESGGSSEEETPINPMNKSTPKIKKAKMSSSKRAGIIFPVARVGTQIRKISFGKPKGGIVRKEASVFLAAVGNYITTEVLECIILAEAERREVPGYNAYDSGKVNTLDTRDISWVSSKSKKNKHNFRIKPKNIFTVLSTDSEFSKLISGLVVSESGTLPISRVFLREYYKKKAQKKAAKNMKQKTGRGEGDSDASEHEIVDDVDESEVREEEEEEEEEVVVEKSSKKKVDEENSEEQLSPEKDKKRKLQPPATPKKKHRGSKLRNKTGRPPSRNGGRDDSGDERYELSERLTIEGERTPKKQKRDGENRGSKDGEDEENYPQGNQGKAGDASQSKEDPNNTDQGEEVQPSQGVSSI